VSVAAGPAEFPGRQWEASPPAAQGIDAARLGEAVRYLEQHAGGDGVSQLFIVRNGRVVWSGPRVDAVHGVWSMTKSFTSTVLGLLIDDGKTELDAPAARYVPALARDYPALTLRHFTTMTSGYRAVGDEPKGSYRHGPSETPFLPAAPNFTPPGSRYLYWDSAMNQFANALTRIAGEPIAALFRRRIADPIDMDSAEWRWGDLGKAGGLTVNGGAGNRGMLEISARQAARLGLLFLREGRWNGKQLISRGWVKQAIAAQVQAPTAPESPVAGTGVYGFNWWVNGTGADGRRKWPGAPAGTFAALGHNNNRMFVVPEWNLVVVRLGLDQRDRVMSDEVYSEFFKILGGALQPRP
jgi:CubicO group peptidase (beta-lactamase class C family)